MKFIFSHSNPRYGRWPCPYGNFGPSKGGTYAGSFLNCNGIKGLIEKLRKLLS